MYYTQLYRRYSLSVLVVVILFQVTCRLDLAYGAQPTYTSGANTKQGLQQQASSSSSQGKIDRSEDVEGSMGGPPPIRHSGKGYSSMSLPKSSSSMYTSSMHGYYPVSGRYFTTNSSLYLNLMSIFRSLL